jgi:hypothetical protein
MVVETGDPYDSIANRTDEYNCQTMLRKRTWYLMFPRRWDTTSTSRGPWESDDYLPTPLHRHCTQHPAEGHELCAQAPHLQTRPWLFLELGEDCDLKRATVQGPVRDICISMSCRRRQAAVIGRDARLTGPTHERSVRALARYVSLETRDVAPHQKKVPGESYVVRVRAHEEFFVVFPPTKYFGCASSSTYVRRSKMVREVAVLDGPSKSRRELDRHSAA